MPLFYGEAVRRSTSNTVAVRYRYTQLGYASPFWSKKLSQKLPSPFGRGAGGEGIVGRIAKTTAFSLPALTLTLSRRERGP